MTKLVPSVLDPATLRIIELNENSIVLRFQDGGHIVIRASSNGDLIVDSTKEKESA